MDITPLPGKTIGETWHEFGVHLAMNKGFSAGMSYRTADMSKLSDDELQSLFAEFLLQV